ncbi:alpha/beta fold hydrolase [Oceanibacterium hippocampi]|uniref:Putative non-heme bromoperoxidase BpoC n=1 Tax=Oceanibacterium hippocampi TaxID=745714 RepID=A0A1Y5TZX8_9PROT|nr:alpha/beta fold hydrolase [Oceanibacterium hippocampi]SLN77456.1 Putative non-heme bromoperoxidase BpoC [Oceanibacterium hippocampi]
MSAKLPLVLAPGLLCTGELWEPQIAAFGHDREIVVVDNASDDDMAAIARRALAEAPGHFALAGLSMGGYIALEIARQAPSRVRGLALLDTSARADTPDMIQRRKDFIALSRRGKFHGVTEQLLPIILHEDHLGDQTLVETVYRMAAETGVDGFLRQQLAIMGRADQRARLGEMSMPALVLCGREDKLTPLALHEEMAAGLPDATLAIIERCGHLSTLEQPAAVNEAMAGWLARIEGPAAAA